MSDASTSPAGTVRMTLRRDHVPVLDGVRAIAILLVLVAHMPWKEFPKLLQPGTYGIQPGYMGVDLFFVLSGFLITRILLVDRDAGKPIMGFLAKRALRIFPIYYLAILFFAFVEPGAYLWWCAAYLSNFFFAWDDTPGPLRHTWSLAIEEHFYMIWPFVVYLLPVKWSRLVAFVGFPLLSLGSAAALVLYRMNSPEEYAAHFPDEPRHYFYLLTMFRAMSLSLGACLAYIESTIRANVRRTLLAAGVCVLLMLPFLAIAHFTRGSSDWPSVCKMAVYSLLSTTALLLALSTHGLGRWASWPLDNPIMSYIGRISYGLYLYHYPIFRAMGFLPEGESGAHEAPLSRIPLAVAASFAVATLSFYLIERPILKYKDRLTFSPRKAPHS